VHKGQWVAVVEMERGEVQEATVTGLN
jgi:hypothetical protein